MNYTQKQQEAIARHKFFKASEAKYRATHEKNPSFPWSDWGDRPRAGAVWTLTELTELHRIFTSTIGTVQTVVFLCDLAWKHGRSVDAIFEKLRQEFGSTAVFKRFDLTKPL